MAWEQDSAKETSTLRVQISATNYQSSLGKMANFRVWIEKVKYEPGASCARKHGSAQRMMGTHHKATEVILQRLPSAKLGIILA